MKNGMTSQKINKLKRWWMSEEIHKSEWIFMIFIGVLTLAMFRYADLESFTVWSLNFWDALFSGKINEFYGYTALNLSGVPSQYYGGGIFTVLVLAICNFPLWVVKELFGCDVMTSFGAIFYAKLVLTAFFAGTLNIADKICRKLEMGKKDRLFMVFLSATSLFTYSAISYCGQNDILDIFFCVLAIYALIYKKNVWFLILMAISIAIKPFTIFIFLPVLLLVEKNIIKIVLKTFSMIAFSFFWYLLYFGESTFWTSLHSNQNTGGILKSLMESTTFAVSLGTISLFFFCFIILLFVCFITKCNDDTELIQMISYYSFAAMSFYFLFSGFEPYRIIMLIPFMYILIAYKKEIRLLNIILDFFINIAYFVFVTYTFYWCYSSERMDHMLITDIFGQKDHTASAITSYRDLYEMVGIGQVVTVINTIFVVALTIMLVINHPKFKIKYHYDFSKVNRGLLWLRSFIIIPFILLVWVMYYKF